MILDRIAGERFSMVRPLWSGHPVVILGGGPSLTAEQFALVKAARAANAVRVIAINDSFLPAPWADVCYAADAKWFRWMQTGIAKPALGLGAAAVRERWAAFPGEKCGIEAAGHLPDDVHVLRVSHLTGALSRDAGALSTGRQDGYAGHSGFQALNLATLAGATTILLLGYDGGPNAHGQTHFHGDHAIPTPADVWPFIARSFSCIENELKAAGVLVINCSPVSAIGSFEKVALADALAVAA
ncbi:MAG TPA: hypothetical protein VLH12_08750 [Usitatibacter sp.]|nr:hypothetical protein [Usitatibacter sp.]